MPLHFDDLYSRVRFYMITSEWKGQWKKCEEKAFVCCFCFHHQDYVGNKNLLITKWFGEDPDRNGSSGVHWVPNKCQDYIKYIIYIILFNPKR